MKRPVFALLAALLFSGCATPKIDWAARVGHYTYDQSVMDFGPPDKFAKLSDGSMVAEWLSQPGRIITTPGPYFVAPGYCYGPVLPMYYTTYLPAQFLRLAFDPNGKLKTWKEFDR